MLKETQITKEQELVEALHDISDAVTPRGAWAAMDSSGGSVHSLTEAVMGMTSGLIRIAESISELSQAVRDHNEVSDV